ncbi:hypothetical protein ID866_7471 [Astraeus odoratus]|nr:hypothetical protein ID866_7471 [Astraeus odoratus]
MAPPSFRLALLECSNPGPQILGTDGYTPVFYSLLEASLALANASTPEEAERVSFTLDGYDVMTKMEYPSNDTEYDGLFISGAPSSAYEDIEWINKLVAYVKRAIEEKPKMKIFGICFGHQIIARALGGSCVPNNGKWEVAVTNVQLTALGKAIFRSDDLDIQQMHQDHVPALPPNCHLLGSTPVALNQGFVVFESSYNPSAESLESESPTVPLPSIHIFTVQGHPEFTPRIMHAILDARIKHLGDAVVADGRMRADGIPGKKYTGGRACNGVDIVGKTIWGILGVA